MKYNTPLLLHNGLMVGETALVFGEGKNVEDSECQYILLMEAPTEQKKLRLKDVVITENSDLGRFFGGRVLFPEKNELAKEQIRKYGLPKGLSVSK
ncbi:MAG: hypothetical protein EOO39_12405 [Cytophagaceae bacterium]|nr:MAG: hypothetical protein EOO39_12405 [Cytophagaceae bacterium]